MVQRIFDSILSLSGLAAYSVIGTLAFLEAALFVGLFLPGETALLFGGVLASQGRVNLAVLLVVAVVAAIAGDSVGYEVGRRGGPALKRSRVGRIVGEERWSRADAFVARRGGPAVLLGRWVGLLRVLVPAVAGMSRMPYPRFLLFNAVGGTVWAVAVVLLGYAAGHSISRVQAYLGRASLLGVALLIVGVVVVAAARYAARHRSRTLALLHRVHRSAVVRAVEGPVVAVVDRVASSRGSARGMAAGWIIALLALAGVAVAFAQLFDNVLDGEGVAGLDRPVLRWLADHRDDEATRMMQAVTALAGPVVLPLVSLVGAGVLRWRTGRWTPVVLVAVTTAGAGVITLAGKHLVGRARPGTGFAVGAESGFSFPSGHSLMSAAIIGIIGVLVARVVRSWAARVWTVLAAGLVTGLIGLSRLYLGVHWLTDVLGAWLLAALWVGTVLLVWSRSLAWRTAHGHHDSHEGTADSRRAP